MLIKSCFLHLIVLLQILLASGCGDEVITMQPESSYRIVDAAVISASLSADSKLAAVLTADQTVSVWDTQKRTPIQRWDASVFDNEVSHLALSGDKQLVVVGGLWTVTVLSIANGSVVYTWDVLGFQPGATISALHVDKTGYRILVGMTDGAVLSGDLNSGNALKMDHHELMVTRLAFDDESHYAISGATDKNFAYWHTKDGEISYQHNFRSRITALVVDDRSNKLFVSDALQTHWIIDKRNGNKLAELDYFENFRFFRRGHFVEQGRYLVTTSPKDEVTLWNAQSGDEIVSWKIKRYTANATVISLANNETNELMTLSSDGVIQTWDYRKFLR
ncbi:WD40 repeat domain-containing protein [Alteromonas ponticola]|uniref:WD40 repeat domain-containing protein n=1 Tax=Alteromonas ponticola TaxID=2720613 RepID=A0ABX1R165_9ALTE|nr:WD40 repeat domain-containing protein [Alteromonas ponticola]NMH60209.1 WD40 repeat domain-containing protein [Alteromonas ponticola]